MKIKFTEDVELEVVTNYNEVNDSVDTNNETFKKGETVDVDILAQHEQTSTLQFGDGSTTYNVPNQWFTHD